MSEVPKEKQLALTETKTETRIKCPHCGKSGSTFDHLVKPGVATSFGPWSCERCSAKIKYFMSAEGELTFEELPADSARTLVLLEYHDNKVPLRLVVRGYAFVRDGVLDLDSEYYYGEHTCPTNFFRVEVVCDAGDLDPHGVFQFVRAITIADALKQLGITYDELFDCNNEEYMATLFPELLLREGSGDTVIDGEVNAAPLQLGNNPA